MLSLFYFFVVKFLLHQSKWQGLWPALRFKKAVKYRFSLCFSYEIEKKGQGTPRRRVLLPVAVRLDG